MSYLDIEPNLLGKDAIELRKPWLVDSCYRIDQGSVRPFVGANPCALAEMRSLSWGYNPMNKPEALTAFVQIADGVDTEQAVLTFVHRFGLLGYYEILTAALDERLSAGSFVGFGDQEVRPQMRWSKKIREQMESGESIYWILGHARAVRLVLAIADALYSGASLKKEFEDLGLIEGGDKPGSEKLSYTYMRRFWQRPARRELLLKSGYDSSAIASRQTRHQERIRAKQQVDSAFRL